MSTVSVVISLTVVSGPVSLRHRPAPGPVWTARRMSAIDLVEDDDRARCASWPATWPSASSPPTPPHWDETEEFAEASLEALRRAELFTVTVGEEYGGMGMGDIEAAIVLEELARVDVSSAILCQLVFNGPPRAIEHLGNETLAHRWLPLAAAGELFCIGITEPDAGSAATTDAGAPHPRRRRLAARGLQELRHRRSQGRGVPGLVPVPRQRGRHGQGHRRRGRRPRRATV